MDKYEVLLSPRAFRDLDSIYAYIAETLLESGTAEAMANELGAGILSLEQMPYRCPERKVGAYANHGYRQLLIKNYVVIYRILEEQKQVLTKYSKNSPSSTGGG